VPTLQGAANFGLDTTFDLVNPIKARAYDALQAVLRSKPRALTSGPQLMRRGDERC
jgi:hypothetical protein